MKIIDQAESIQNVPSGYFTSQFSKLNLSTRNPKAIALTVLSSNLEKFLDDHYVLLKNISFRKPQRATRTFEVDDDLLVRKAGKEVVGLTILNASARIGKARQE